MTSRRRCPKRSISRPATTSLTTPLLLLCSLWTSSPSSLSCCQAVHLDIHVPLPNGCLKYQALQANLLLRQASSSRSLLLSLSQSKDGKEGDEEETTVVPQPSERVNLFADHTPHVTLYLADFDLEDRSPKAAGADDATAPVALNQTKVTSFLDAISSLNLTQIIAGLTCPLSLSQDPESQGYYNINGDYTMLPVRDTQCLRTLSTTLLHSLQGYLREPVVVPAWVASLPEPARSAAIYRSRTYGSPNVLEGFEPHVTVGYDPSGGKNGPDPSSSALASAMRGAGSSRETLSAKDTTNVQWRIDAMEQWNEAYRKARETCTDEVEGIALGRTGVGGTVLAHSRMGYWDLLPKAKQGDDNDHSKGDDADELYSAVG